ncbi:MAG: PEP-utilizing enzyme [Ilumatobacter sp.]|uniref:PEP-utilizing enzyme n=1 Tax=Ilumatobacter sp. TaxID=1967498 RepID=UPI003918ED9F
MGISMSGGSSTVDAWEAPGPGTWTLDTAHFEPSVSRPVRDVMEAAMSIGLTQGFELAGAPLRRLDARFVHGHMYTRMVPLFGAGRDLPPPPARVVWLVTRLHPEFRRRARRSVDALASRYWMDELARWEREWKPKLRATNRRLGDVPVGALSARELGRHLASVLDHVNESHVLHFRLHTSDLAPIAQLLLKARELDLDEAAVMSTLAGASPATSAPAVAAAAIAVEIEAAQASPASLDEIRAVSDRAAALLDEYLAEFGNRISTGYDLRDRTLAEIPEVIVTTIVAADTSADRADAAESRGAAALDGLLAGVPETERAEVVSLVEDARALYGLRDENGPLTVQWPLGVLRKALLEAARRLLDAGRIHEVEHVFDASIEETVAMLDGADVPSADDLAERCAARRRLADLDPPTVLGPPAVDPPIEVLPGEMGRMMRGVMLVMELLEREDHVTVDVARSTGLSGVGIGQRAVRGVARVVADANEAFDRVEPGDIIVTRLTVPTFNSVLAMAGGVVTLGGGLLSHTAVIARELGIPAIVGVPGALTEIPDGSEIEIDPVAGTVTVVGDG